MELCLQQYEYGFEMGFVGDRPEDDDPFAYLSPYWTNYTNLTTNILEDFEQQIEQVQVEYPE